MIAEVSLTRIRNNARVFKKLAGRPLYAVVKDDAYGHGAERTARALHGIADGFAVATVDEGAALRVAGVTEDILVLCPAVNGEEARRIAAYGLIATASSLASLRLLLGVEEPIRAHFSVNTGMNRYGFRPERLKEGCRLAGEGGLSVEGVYSHYYLPENRKVRALQTRLFHRARGVVLAAFPGAVSHIAATGGVLAGGELFDAVRVGIGLYGYLPAGFPARADVKPAMKIYASVTHSCTFTGGGVGYAAASKRYKKLHTLRLGYGDGLFRAGGVGVGKLCMDACVAEGRGDFGRRKLVMKDVSAYARAHGTTEYEALVRLGKGAVRFYDGL